MDNLNFTPFTKKHFEILFSWFQTPQIKKWYCQNKSFSLDDIIQKYSPRLEGKDDCPSFIVCFQDQKIGFIQYYSLEDSFPKQVDKNHPILKDHSPKVICGIDLFIGEEKLLNHGLGKEIILAFTEQILKDKFDIILIDPAINNLRAINCYKKSGFDFYDPKSDREYALMVKYIRSKSM